MDNIQKHFKILRGPYQLTLDITNRCNLRCLHCYNSSGENNCIDNEMSDNEFLNLIDEIASFEPLNICFCGGEPLMRKELLLKSIKKISDCNIMSSMVSNGTLLTKEVAKELKDAGLKRTQISIDGIGKSHDRLRDLDGVFEKAVQALNNLKEVGIDRGIAFTPTSWNIDELESVFNLAMEVGASELRIQATMEMGRGNKNAEKIIPSDVQYRKLVRKIFELDNMCNENGYNIKIQWGDPIDHLIRFPVVEKECCTYVSIKANGAIVPSVYIPLSVGNIRRHSFLEYWKNGLGKVWQLPQLKEASAKVRSVCEMNTSKLDMPETFIENDIDIDIIDRNIRF